MLAEADVTVRCVGMADGVVLTDAVVGDAGIETGFVAVGGACFRTGRIGA